jgi:hypothetical protein
MPFDRKFDPVTQDFVSDGRGGYERTQTAETSVMNQLTAIRGAWWGDAELGTFEDGLRELQANPPQLAEQALRRGLGRLEALGRITAVEVRATEPVAGRVRADTKFRDTSTGQKVDTFVRSGG